MRIISGKYKNRELRSPHSLATHPMGERERLAIFNMLGPLEDKTVLDLFAGTGALGIEALSRGAKTATFVEYNSKTFTVLKDNLKEIDGATALKQDAYKYLPDECFDVIFIDPPYDSFDERILDYRKFLAKDGVIAVSSPKPINPDSRKYANCFITLLRNTWQEGYWP